MVFQAQKLIFAWTFVLKDEFEMAIKCNAAVAQFHGALSLSLSAGHLIGCAHSIVRKIER